MNARVEKYRQADATIGKYRDGDFAGAPGALVAFVDLRYPWCRGDGCFSSVVAVALGAGGAPQAFLRVQRIC